MTTPAGWYDDGSGRQRWWDGAQWTEHFAPSAETPAVEAEAEAPASENPTVEFTAELPGIPEVPQAPVVPPVTESPAVAEIADAPTTPLTDQVPPYAAPAPTYPAATPAYPSATPGYSPSAQGYPAPAYGAAGIGQPQYPAAAPAPAGLSVIGLVGLGLVVLGTILSCIPLMVVMIIGWVLLFAGFVVSIVSLFLKGRKWPGITGLVLGLIGTVVAFVMAIIFFATMAFNAYVEDLPYPEPTYSSQSEPSDEPTDEPSGAPDAALRPTVEELEVGLRAIIGMSTDDSSAYTDAQVTCFAQAFFDSDLDDSTLRAIADSDGTFEDPQVAGAFAEVFGSNLGTCMFAE